MIAITTETIFLAFVIIGILLLIGKWLRVKVTIFQNFFIPSALIAGFIGLILNRNLIQKFLGIFFDSDLLQQNIIFSDIQTIWGYIPEFFITIIFASLFIGKDFTNFKKSWRILKTQLFYAQTVSWGQYVLGFLLALLILVPFFDANILSAALIEISFEGGHGTAAGLRSTFNQLGYSAGADLAVGIATFGILAGIIFGIVIINWGIRTNKTSSAKRPSELSVSEKLGYYEDDEEPTIELTTRAQSIGTISIHVAFIFLAIGFGMLIREGLIYLEKITWGSAYDVFVFEYIPLFPIAMLAGVIIQLLLSKTNYKRYINRNIILRIQNFSLDFLIVAAIANISLATIGDHLPTFLLLSLTGFLWNILALFLLAPRMIYPYWFERGLSGYGQSMGMTTTALLLLQVVDPKKETPAFETFGYIQLFFEPIFGGGIFTAAALPLIAQFGPYIMLAFTSFFFLLFLILGLITHKKIDKEGLKTKY